MRLDILCTKCAERSRLEVPAGMTPARMTGTNAGPAEVVEYTDGNARADYKCDRCYATIPHGSRCVALEVWGDLRPRLDRYVDEYLERDSESDFDGRGVA